MQGRLFVLARPVGQAGALAAALEAMGARALLFPGMEIVPVAPDAASQSALALADQTDWVFFVSGNAVRHGLPHLAPALRPGAVRPRVAAVGASTARALEACGLGPVLRPCAGEDSEGLLACPELQALAGQRALIVRGTGGRDVLATGLRAAGAAVAYAEVYARRPATQPVAPLLEALAAGAVTAICAMSTETIHNLFDRLGPAWHGALRERTWLVPHPRVAAGARDLGITRVIEAAGSSDEAVVHALQTQSW